MSGPRSLLADVIPRETLFESEECTVRSELLQGKVELVCRQIDFDKRPVHKECACMVTRHNFPHRFWRNKFPMIRSAGVAAIIALGHLPETSWAPIVSNSCAIIEKDGVFKADVEKPISKAWDKLVSVLHQVVTGSLLEDFVPVPELVTTLLQCLFGRDSDRNDA